MNELDKLISDLLIQFEHYAPDWNVICSDRSEIDAWIDVKDQGGKFDTILIRQGQYGIFVGDKTPFDYYPDETYIDARSAFMRFREIFERND